MIQPLNLSLIIIFIGGHIYNLNVAATN